MTQSTAVTVRGVEEVELRKADRLSNVQRLGNILAASGYFSDAREMAQAAVKVMAGEEIGVPPIAAMMGINIIKGKVAMGAHLIASRVRAHGYDFRVKQLDGTGCVLDFLSKPDASGKRTVLGTSSFTEEDAKLAGVYSDMYKKYARNMYYARAVSNGARWYTPDVLSGMPVYVPEELGAHVDGEGEIIHEEQRGSHEGQAAVAERKIAEMKAGKSYAEVSTPEPKAETPKRPWTTFKGMVATFAELKLRLGPYTTIYYQCLEKRGVQHANELKSTAAATAVYLDLLSKVEEYEAMLKVPADELDDEPAQEALGL